MKASDKLAESLEILHSLQEAGIVAVRAGELSRTHRERLVRSGFLKQVIRGWYIASRPDEVVGESTAWYASFWRFCAAYLEHRFAEQWCLSPEQSLSLHAGNWTIPRQLLVRAPAKARNNVTAFPHGTSLLDVRAAIPRGRDIEQKQGLRLFALPAALIACAPGTFRQHTVDLRAALSSVRDASPILERLLEGGHSKIAGRLAGAFRNCGRTQIADDIANTMRTAGYTIYEKDPFETAFPIASATREFSPYVTRIRLMWEGMRDPIIDAFPQAPGLPSDKKVYLKRVEDVYATDAYHSLSIEGYRVNTQLIERVRSGGWNPDRDENDREHRDALAARGYWQAHQAVRKSIGEVLRGGAPGELVERDHGIWYRELFGPSVVAGLLRASDLAGYRNGPVYIRHSMHVPPSSIAIRDAMPAFFELLSSEDSPCVRAVLGHFVFVYIHPYTDGNGRVGRFLMNVMFAAGGYPWTVIPVQDRDEYMEALEAASVNQDIGPFTRFLAERVTRATRDIEVPDEGGV